MVSFGPLSRVSFPFQMGFQIHGWNKWGVGGLHPNDPYIHWEGGTILQVPRNRHPRGRGPATPEAEANSQDASKTSRHGTEIEAISPWPPATSPDGQGVT